jgi:hypothetical protein
LFASFFLFEPCKPVVSFSIQSIFHLLRRKARERVAETWDGDGSELESSLEDDRAAWIERCSMASGTSTGSSMEIGCSGGVVIVIGELGSGRIESTAWANQIDPREIEGIGL